MGVRACVGSAVRLLGAAGQLGFVVSLDMGVGVFRDPFPGAGTALEDTDSEISTRRSHLGTSKRFPFRSRVMSPGGVRQTAHAYDIRSSLT